MKLVNAEEYISDIKCKITVIKCWIVNDYKVLDNYDNCDYNHGIKRIIQPINQMLVNH